MRKLYDSWQADASQADAQQDKISGLRNAVQAYPVIPLLKALVAHYREDEQWAASITRATRSAGSHRVAWDGLDDKGGPLPPGTYTVVLEVNREHGTYCIERGAIVCAKTAAQGKIPASAEFAEAQITFGPPAP